MFCSKCGKKIEDATKFCPYCGSPVTGSTASNIEGVIKKASDTAMNAAKSASNVVRESVEKIDGEAVKDTIKKATDTAVNFTQSVQNTAGEATSGTAQSKNQNRKNTIVGIVVVCLAVLLLFKGCGAVFGDSKGEKLAKAALSAPQYSDCKIKSADKITDSGIWSVYRVKFISPEKKEYSALVEVCLPDYAKIVNNGVYQKSNYDKLNARIEEFKILYNAINK